VQQIKIFVSSPGDADHERRRVERVIERLNGEFAGVTRLQAIRWETEFYRAHQTFQAQIPEAAQCDIVLAVFRGRIGTELPPDFARMPDGNPYPSGTAYEVLTAIEARHKRELPDVFVFRSREPPVGAHTEAEVRFGSGNGIGLWLRPSRNIGQREQDEQESNAACAHAGIIANGRSTSSGEGASLGAGP